MGKRRLTEADMASLPNLTIEEHGHSFDTPKGRVLFTNCHPMDECFGSDLFGVLNITKAWKNVKLSGQPPRTIPLDAALRRNVSRAEYDHQVVKDMTPERREDPILILVGWDGINVIDGIHRIKRRIRDKLTDVKAFILCPETLAYMCVRMFRWREGEWVQEAGLTDDDVKAQIERAKGVEAMLTGRDPSFFLRTTRVPTNFDQTAAGLAPCRTFT